MRRNRSFPARAAKSIGQFFSRLFCVRSIIVVSQHKRGHYPISGGLQFFLLFSIFGIIAWVSYSTGNYVAAQSMLQEKERKLENANLETRRIESEFALLKRDLNKVLNQEEKNLSDYTKFVIGQYEEGEKNPEPVATSDGTLDHGIIFERIAFLENRLEKLKEDQALFVELVRDTTGGKIKELEKVIRMTGLKLTAMEDNVRQEQQSVYDDRPEDKGEPQGGPLEPEQTLDIEGVEPELFDDLQRVALLHQVVEQLPLASPMPDSRLTSGFGRRVDPFTHRPAQHSGLDFAGELHAAVFSPADGTVVTAGKKGAYGNCIDIDHGLGIVTRYGHLSKILVSEGDKVYKGQLIAKQGSSGRSTGPHLHYEVRYRGHAMNPKPFLKAGNHVQ